MRLGTLGHLSCLIFSIAAATLTQGWRVGAALGLTLILAAAFYRDGLGTLRQKRLWLSLGFLFASAALLMEGEDGLAVGAQMTLRAATIVIAVSGFAAVVSIGELAGVLERAGMKGLGFALGVALNMLPIVQETMATTFQALRLRGGFRRERLNALRLVLMTVIVNTLRHADDIVSAAEARAFSPDRLRPQPMVWRRRDAAVTASLFAVTLGLLFIR